jgi:DNA (cytosine-5)-methyltransferase 1
MGKYSFADLFAGCGGLSLGLMLAGMKGRFAIERDAMAFETLSANLLVRQSPAGAFAWPEWLEQRPWDIEHILKEHLADLTTMRGSIDVLGGGPPCQGFSFAGRRMEDDPRNQLFKRYVDVVDAVRPAVILLENVPGMRVAHTRRNVVEMRPATTAGRQSYFDLLSAELHQIGYTVQAELVDASGFGVPQRRSRLIAIGLRADLLEWVPEGIGRSFELLEGARIAQLQELGLKEAVTCEEALSDLVSKPASLQQCTDPMSPRGFMQARYDGPQTHFQRLMNEGAGPAMDSMRLARHREDVSERFRRILAECRRGVRMDDASRKAYGLKKHRIYPMSPSEPAPTVTTLPDDILHYSEPRILTVRECARLQSFPDWFEFKGKYTTGGDRRTKECPRYTQVGNAVPPFLARALGNTIVKLLDEVALTKKIFGGPHYAKQWAAR